MMTQRYLALSGILVDLAIRSLEHDRRVTLLLSVHRRKHRERERERERARERERELNRLRGRRVEQPRFRAHALELVIDYIGCTGNHFVSRSNC